jgi:ribosomal protein L21
MRLIYLADMLSSFGIQVTENDVIVVKNIRPFSVGDRVQFDKVLAVGGREWTMFGRPILP